MMNQAHDEFDDRLRNTFEGLPDVPGKLLDSTVRELKRRRLLPGPYVRSMQFLGMGVLLIAVLAVGYVRPLATTPAIAATHLLLLYEGQGYRAAEPGAEAARVQEYTSWAHELAKNGELVDAAELASESIVAVAGDTLALHGVNSEFGHVTGFFLIAAADNAEASRIAAQCPHLKYGGRVVVRSLVTQ